MLDFPNLSATYKAALQEQLIPFYGQKSPDTRCGGFFDGLSALGQPYDTDKCIARQAEQTGLFAQLYTRLETAETWLAHARQGAAFLYQFAHDDALCCYATVDRRGRPVAPAPDACTEAAVVSAYACLHRATGDDEWAMLAKQTLTGMLSRRESRRIAQLQTVSGYRVLNHLSEPLAVLHALLAVQPLLSEEDWKEHTQSVLHELLHQFLDKRQDILREYIQPEGAFLNTPEGRRLSTGLTFRAASLAHDLAQETGNRKLAIQAAAWTVQCCEWAWDEAKGGLNQWVDIRSQPLAFPDTRQRWAWVHLEGLSALAKGYLYTRHPDTPKWWQRLHEYTFGHFPDQHNGGWHLAIDELMQPIFDIKASPAQGGAGLMAPLLYSWQTTAQCAQLKPAPLVNRLGLFGRRTA